MRYVQLKPFAALTWQCRWCSNMLDSVNRQTPVHDSTVD